MVGNRYIDSAWDNVEVTARVIFQVRNAYSTRQALLIDFPCVAAQVIVKEGYSEQLNELLLM